MGSRNYESFNVKKTFNADGRLTISTGNPVPTSDVTAATSVYYTNYVGNRISLLDSADSIWKEYEFSEPSLSLSGFAASTPFDIYGFVSGGALTLQSVAWTNDTTRATALARVAGRWCKSGTSPSGTHLYLGTIRTTSTIGQCEDSVTKRFVWNNYHRTRRKMFKAESDASWTYSTAAYRAMNNDTTNRIEWVIGLSEEVIPITVLAVSSGSIGGDRFNGIGINTTTANTFDLLGRAGGTINTTHIALLNYQPAIGYTYAQAIELGSGAGTDTWYGGTGSGVMGNIAC